MRCKCFRVLAITTLSLRPQDGRHGQTPTYHQALGSCQGLDTTETAEIDLQVLSSKLSRANDFV